MDFNQFDARAAASVGKDLQLEHPVTGAPIWDGDKPCCVTLIGTESPEARAALNQIQKRKMKTKDENRSLDEIHAALVETAIPLVVGLKNINRGDKPATLADLPWLFNMQQINGQEGEKSFVEQVLAFATKRANFLGNGSAA